MKAKELIKFLSQHPDAEVVFNDYAGLNIISSVNTTLLVSKGAKYPEFERTSTNSSAISSTGKCNTDIIILTNN